MELGTGRILGCARRQVNEAKAATAKFLLTVKRSAVSARSRIWEVGATPERASRFPGHAGARAGAHVLLWCGRSRLPLTKSDCGGIQGGREPSGSTLAALPFDRGPNREEYDQRRRVSRGRSLPR